MQESVAVSVTAGLREREGDPEAVGVTVKERWAVAV